MSILDNTAELRELIEIAEALPTYPDTVEQATPTITVDNTGKITATVTQSEGFVEGGTKSETKQLTTQAAKTITPSTSVQTAVAAGRYTTGVVKVGAIPDEYIIPSGTLSVTQNGTHDVTNYASVNVDVAGSGGNCEIEDGLITKQISVYENSRVTSIGAYAFRGCSRLTSVNFPACATINTNAFYSCSSLTYASFPACATINSYAFYGCSSLTSASFPVCTNISVFAFCGCSSLTYASFPVAAIIGNGAFDNCSNLEAIILRKTNGICNLSASSAFERSSIANGTGYIYVPANLVDSYKSATNWAPYASQFRAIEDYPDVCG